MNVLWQCYLELFGQHGLALFSLPFASQDPSVIVQALQYCCQTGVQPSEDQTGKVRVLGRRVCCIPRGTMHFVATMCSEQFGDTTVHFELCEVGLPAGLLASPALIRVICGTAYVPVVNVGTLDVMVYLHRF